MKIFAHRGFIKNTPYQNSLEAFKQCLTTTDGFETDVIKSADNTLYLLHDNTSKNKQPYYDANQHLNEASQAILGLRKIHELSDAEVQNLRLKDDSPIPLLEDVLNLLTVYKNKTVNLEIKGYEVEQLLAPVLQTYLKAGKLLPEQIVVSSFNHQAVHYMKKKLPKLQYGLLWSNQDEHNTPIYYGVEDVFYKTALQCEDEKELIKSIKPQYMIISHLEANDDVLQKIKSVAASSKVIVWEYTEKNAAERPILSFIKQHKTSKDVFAAIVDTPLPEGYTNT